MAESGLSNEVSAVTVLPAPSSPTLSLNSDSVNVSWTNNDDSSDGSITVQRSIDGGSTYTDAVTGLSPSTTSTTDSVSLSDGETYTYRIIRETDHETANSGSSSISTPQSVGQLDFNSTAQGEVSINWSGVSNNDGYAIYRAQSSGITLSDTQIVEVGSSTTGYTNTGLKDGERYYYAVGATKDGYTSTLSEDTTVTSLTPPSDVDVIEQTASNVNITWTNNDNNPDGDIEIRRSNDGGSTYTTVQSVSPSTTSYGDGNTQAGETYTYLLVRSTDHASAISGIDSVSLVDRPSNLSVSQGVEGELDLTWDAAKNESGIRVYVAANSGGNFTQVADLPPGTTSYTDTNLQDGARFYYEVAAYKNIDDGTYQPPPTNEDSAITVLPTPSQPTVSETTEGNIAVSWTNRDNSPSGGIDVERSVDGSTSWNTISSSLSYNTTEITDTTTSSGTTYEYRIERNTDDATTTSVPTSFRLSKDMSRTATVTGNGSLSTTRSTTKSRSATVVGGDGELTATRGVLTKTRTATITADGRCDTSRSGIPKTRANTVTGDGQLDATRQSSKPRTATMTGEGAVSVSRRGISKPRTATVYSSGGAIHTRAEFREVFADEKTDSLSWDFSYDPFGFVSEWITETEELTETEAFTVVVDSVVSDSYDVGVEYDLDGDGVAEHRTDTQSVTTDGQTLVFPTVGDPGQYRIFIQQMRPDDFLREVTVGLTRY